MDDSVDVDHRKNGEDEILAKKLCLLGVGDQEAENSLEDERPGDLSRVLARHQDHSLSLISFGRVLRIRDGEHLDGILCE